MIVYLLSRKRASRITYRAVSALPSRSASLTSCLTLPSLRSRRGALLCDPSLLPPRPWPCGRDSTARLPASNGPTNRPNSLKSGCVNYLQSSKSPLFEAFLYSIYSRELLEFQFYNASIENGFQAELTGIESGLKPTPRSFEPLRGRLSFCISPKIL